MDTFWDSVWISCPPSSFHLLNNPWQAFVGGGSGWWATWWYWSQIKKCFLQLDWQLPRICAFLSVLRRPRHPEPPQTDQIRRRSLICLMLSDSGRINDSACHQTCLACGLGIEGLMMAGIVSDILWSFEMMADSALSIWRPSVITKVMVPTVSSPVVSLTPTRLPVTGNG